jgi:hypothetical protein
MIRALAASTTWVLTGAATFAAFYWGFINTPESTIFMLALSLLLVVGMGVVLGVMWSGALDGWSRGWSRGTLRRAFGGVPAFVPAAAFVLAVWWLVGRGLGWLDAHSGEIGAWFIASFDWSDVRPLLGGVHYAGDWLRVVVAPFAALVWLGETLSHGWRPPVERTWLRRAFSPTRLVLATIVVGVFIIAPLSYGLYWMPAGLPPTWVEPAFALAKVAVFALAGAVGLSLIARLAAPVGPRAY